jgi:hypothetical protein
MTVRAFENGYWFVDELKGFAARLGLPGARRLRKDELEKADAERAEGPTPSALCVTHWDRPGHRRSARYTVAMAGGCRSSRVGRDVQMLLAALAGLALAPGCGSGASAQQGRSKDAAMGTDANDAATSLWETMVQPVIYAWYTSVSLGPPGTVYALERDEGAYAYDGGMNDWSIASSHDDGQTWTTTTLPMTNDTYPQVSSVVAIGATDVYAFGFTAIPPVNGATILGSPGLVAKSTDNGATFTQLNPTFSGMLLAGGADGAGNPIGAGAATDGGFFVRSTDGGATWSRVAVPGTTALEGVWTTASGTIYACGTPATAPAPPDGGTDAGRPDGGADAGDGGAAVAPAGVVVRSDDNGNTWTTVTTTPNRLWAISGTSDGSRVIAVGDAFTQVESADSGASWDIYDGAYQAANENSPYSNFGSVWLPNGNLSAPYIADGAPYVVTGLAIIDDVPFAAGINEALPTDKQELQSANAVAGNATEVWAVGYGIFRRR